MFNTHPSLRENYKSNSKLSQPQFKPNLSLAQLVYLFSHINDIQYWVSGLLYSFSLYVFLQKKTNSNNYLKELKKSTQNFKKKLRLKTVIICKQVRILTENNRSLINGLSWQKCLQHWQNQWSLKIFCLLKDLIEIRTTKKSYIS